MTPAQRLAELRAKATGTYWERYGFIGHYDLARVRCPIGCDRAGRQKYADVPVHGHDAAFIVYAANNAPAIAARERELEEENATANREIDHRDGELAAACDMLNSWCRESGVEECSSPYEGLGLQKTIDRLWGCVNEKHYKQLTAKDAEIGGLAMLVLLLMRRLSTDASNDKLVSQAKDYLIRKGLQGSPLRESEATDEQ